MDKHIDSEGVRYSSKSDRGMQVFVEERKGDAVFTVTYPQESLIKKWLRM